MKLISELKVKLFADGAEKAGILEMYKKPFIQGFTTNPSLMRKAGIKNYKAFALDILKTIKNRPISFEVISDDFKEMYSQALEIASWAENVYVKIPVSDTKGKSTLNLIQLLKKAGVKQNITALMTLEQVRGVAESLAFGPSAYLSLFAGRIADTGRDPMIMMKKAVAALSPYPNLALIWASPRELLNIFQADEVGCHIITVTHDILKKLSLVGKDLNQYSLDTVNMLYNDALKAGFTLDPTQVSTKEEEFE